MTQKYYTDRLLPVYIDAIQTARLKNGYFKRIMILATGHAKRA